MEETGRKLGEEAKKYIKELLEWMIPCAKELRDHLQQEDPVKYAEMIAEFDKVVGNQSK